LLTLAQKFQVNPHFIYYKKHAKMNSEEIRNYCIAKKHTTESFPFDEYSLVFKVAGKMFALLDIEAELRMNLKCDPEYALQLREKYASIQPGYHMKPPCLTIKHTRA